MTITAQDVDDDVIPPQPHSDGVVRPHEQTRPVPRPTSESVSQFNDVAHVCVRSCACSRIKDSTPALTHTHTNAEHNNRIIECWREDEDEDVDDDKTTHENKVDGRTRNTRKNKHPTNDALEGWSNCAHQTRVGRTVGRTHVSITLLGARVTGTAYHAKDAAVVAVGVVFFFLRMWSCVCLCISRVIRCVVGQKDERLNVHDCVRPTRS